VKVVVVGGGLGGLFVAAELQRRGVAVTIFEASSNVGGVAGTITRDGYILEPAAGSFLLPDPALSVILKAAAVDVVPIEGGNRRLYTTGTGYSDIPSSPSEFLRSDMVGPTAKLRVIRELLIRSRTWPGESLHSFLVRHFGQTVGAIVAELMATGVFAGDPQSIEAAAYPPLVELEARSGSLIRGVAARRKGPRSGRTLHVPTLGMRQLAVGLARSVGDVRTDTPATSMEIRGDVIRVNGEPADHVVLAVSPEVVGHLLSAESTHATPTAPVAVVGLGGSKADMGLPSDAFGLLAGPGAASPVLGILFEKGPGRAPEGHQLVKVLVGGARHGDAFSDDDPVIVRRVIGDVSSMLGYQITPTFTEVARREIPQYVSGHAARTADLAGRLPERVELAGWWYGGIGIGSLAADAIRIADRMTES